MILIFVGRTVSEGSYPHLAAHLWIIHLYKRKRDHQDFDDHSDMSSFWVAGKLLAKVFLILSALQTKPDTCANIVDPDETAHNKPSHQDLYSLPFCFETQG